MSSPLPTSSLEPRSPIIGTRLSTLAASGETHRVRVPTFLRRVLKVKHLDFELAAWQLAYLCISPRMVYKQLFYHKQTKNIWARDDPAIVLIICAMLCVSAIAWGATYHLSILGIIRLALLMVFRDFLGSGLILATTTWLFSRVFLMPSQPISNQSIGNAVEWAYAFDIHTNSFFPLYLSLYLLQLFLSPLITRNRWICLWLGNTVYLVAFSQYIYITYLGLSALPFLVRSKLVLFPLIPIMIFYVVSLLGFNISRSVLSLYFGE